MDVFAATAKIKKERKLLSSHAFFVYVNQSYQCSNILEVFEKRFITIKQSNKFDVKKYTI
jgi:hypothetical protein